MIYTVIFGIIKILLYFYYTKTYIPRILIPIFQMNINNNFNIFSKITSIISCTEKNIQI